MKKDIDLIKKDIKTLKDLQITISDELAPLDTLAVLNNQMFRLLEDLERSRNISDAEKSIITEVEHLIFASDDIRDYMYKRLDKLVDY